MIDRFILVNNDPQVLNEDLFKFWGNTEDDRIFNDHENTDHIERIEVVVSDIWMKRILHSTKLAMIY